MKKYIFICSIVLVLVFLLGYRLGLLKNNQYTIEYMNSLSNQFIAARAASGIVEFGRMKNEANGNSILICHMKKEVQRLSEDWTNCQSDSICQNKMQGGFFSEVNEVIDIFKREKCL